MDRDKLFIRNLLRKLLRHSVQKKNAAGKTGGSLNHMVSCIGICIHLTLSRAMTLAEIVIRMQASGAFSPIAD